MIPAAIAWACNPQAHINLSQSSYAPGSSITVYGSYFPGNVPISISGPSGSTSATTSPGGAFVTSMTAPSQAGDYVISASKPTGGSAPASFSVQAAQPAPTPAPPAFVAPKVTRSPVPAASTAPSVTPTGTPTPTISSPAVTGVSSPGVVTTGGQQVFAGSVGQVPVFSTPIVGARGASSPGRGHGGAVTTATAPSASQLTATSDLWSGFGPGQPAALNGGSQGMSGGGTSSALTIGIGLLGFGLVALVAGLTVAEVRRRRAIS
jgi:hypothetical protein